MGLKLHAAIIVTYRCNAKCNMCNVWHNPTRPSEEITLKTISKLPDVYYANITGGEPFVRTDLPEIIDIVSRKAKRVVISTNGYFTEKIINLCKKHPALGIRISIEGLPKTNDDIRQIDDGFDKGLRTLLELRAMGVKDIGFAMTVQDKNCKDLVPLYHLAKALGYEFATATLHNSHYFAKFDNVIENKAMVSNEFERLINELLRSKKAKEWLRGYFNLGLVNYFYGKQRLLPCEMGDNGFFIDPYGDILACNGMDKKESFGNLNDMTWEEIWHGNRANEIREMVKTCKKNCWMMGSAAPAILHHPIKPAFWVIKNKLRSLGGKSYSICNK
jgi:Fe-coproporphyrin III synthase